MTVTEPRKLLQPGNDLVCSFDIAPGLAQAEVKTFLSNNMDTIAVKFNALMTQQGARASDCSMLPDFGNSVRIKCSVAAAPAALGQLDGSLQEFQAALRLAVSSRVIDVSVNLLHGESHKPLAISLGVKGNSNVEVGSICDTFLSDRSVWDRMGPELQHEYDLIGSEDDAVCTVEAR